MMKIIFWTVVWFVLFTVILYTTNTFNWQKIVKSFFTDVTLIDERVLDNPSLALRQARIKVIEELSRDVDISQGPCLAETLIPNWSLDLVHHPREAIDDLEANQCYNYRTGITKRIIEFDISGNFIGINYADQ